jgi:hypothetical protein
MTGVEFDHACAVNAGGTDLPVRLDRGIQRVAGSNPVGATMRSSRFSGAYFHVWSDIFDLACLLRCLLGTAGGVLWWLPG